MSTNSYIAYEMTNEKPFELTPEETSALSSTFHKLDFVDGGIVGVVTAQAAAGKRRYLERQDPPCWAL